MSICTNERRFGSIGKKEVDPRFSKLCLLVLALHYMHGHHRSITQNGSLSCHCVQKPHIFRHGKFPSTFFPHYVLFFCLFVFLKNNFIWLWFIWLMKKIKSNCNQSGYNWTQTESESNTWIFTFQCTPSEERRKITLFTTLFPKEPV